MSHRNQKVWNDGGNIRSEYAKIERFVDDKLTKLQSAIQNNNLDEYTYPDGAYATLYPSVSPDKTPLLKKVKLDADSIHTPSSIGKAKAPAQKLVPLGSSPSQTQYTFGQTNYYKPPSNLHQGFLVADCHVPTFDTVPEFCHKFSKQNMNCTRNPCSNKHTVWEEYTRAQQSEIGIEVSAVPNLDLSEGLCFDVNTNIPFVIPPGKGNPVPPPHPTQRAGNATQAPPLPPPQQGAWCKPSGWGRRLPKR